MYDVIINIKLMMHIPYLYYICNNNTYCIKKKMANSSYKILYIHIHFFAYYIYCRTCKKWSFKAMSILVKTYAKSCINNDIAISLNLTILCEEI